MTEETNKNIAEETNKNIAEKTENKRIVANFLDGSFLTGTFFVKQMPFIFFCGFLSIIYISNRNIAEKTLNNITEMQREVREIRSESITIASNLMFISKQSEVYNLVQTKELGLQEATEPPKKLKVEKID